jgi:hypothetical protein
MLNMVLIQEELCSPAELERKKKIPVRLAGTMTTDYCVQEFFEQYFRVLFSNPDADPKIVRVDIAAMIWPNEAYARMADAAFASNRFEVYKPRLRKMAQKFVYENLPKMMHRLHSIAMAGNKGDRESMEAIRLGLEFAGFVEGDTTVHPGQRIVINFGTSMNFPQFAIPGTAGAAVRTLASGADGAEASDDMDATMPLRVELPER